MMSAISVTDDLVHGGSNYDVARPRIATNLAESTSEEVQRHGNTYPLWFAARDPKLTHRTSEAILKEQVSFEGAVLHGDASDAKERTEIYRKWAHKARHEAKRLIDGDDAPDASVQSEGDILGTCPCIPPVELDDTVPLGQQVMMGLRASQLMDTAVAEHELETADVREHLDEAAADKALHQLTGATLQPVAPFDHHDNLDVDRYHFVGTLTEGATPFRRGQAIIISDELEDAPCTANKFATYALIGKVESVTRAPGRNKVKVRVLPVSQRANLNIERPDDGFLRKVLRELRGDQQRLKERTFRADTFALPITLRRTLCCGRGILFFLFTHECAVSARWREGRERFSSSANGVIPTSNFARECVVSARWEHR